MLKFRNLPLEAFLKISQNYRKIPVLKSLSNTAKDLQAVRLSALLKRNPRIGVLKPAVHKCSLK